MHATLKGLVSIETEDCHTCRHSLLLPSTSYDFACRIIVWIHKNYYCKLQRLCSFDVSSELP